ncbi:MAG: hypothetical protein R3F33_10750 [Planctomycetota bacterium]
MLYLLLPPILPLLPIQGLEAPKFQAPLELQAAGAPLRIESPGYAAPCLYDIDGDGHKELIVGQFREGKIQVFRNQDEAELAAGTWLQAEGEPAKVPGVW